MCYVSLFLKRHKSTISRQKCVTFAGLIHYSSIQHTAELRLFYCTQDIPFGYKKNNSGFFLKPLKTIKKKLLPRTRARGLELKF